MRLIRNGYPVSGYFCKVLAKMQLYISRSVYPEAVKASFSGWYPFLKMELYLLNQDFLLLPSQKHQPKIKNFCNLQKEGFVNIDHQVTIAELNISLADFGLRTEVFRKSGNVWVATVLTENWTLEQQNNAGEEITNTA